MEKLPHWSLKTIYPGLESAEFNADLKGIGLLAQELDSMLNGEVQDFSQWLKELLEKYQTLLDTGETLTSYAYAMLSVSTGDESALKGMSRVEEALLDLKGAHVKVLNALAHYNTEIEQITQTGGDLAPFRFVLEELLDEQKHTMSATEEALAADLNRFGSDAFSRLQEAIASQATAILDGQEKTVVELRPLAFAKERKVRESAYKKELEIFKTHETAFAYALNGVKGTTISLAKRRGYPSALAQSLKQARISEAVLATLIGTIEDYLPLFRRYLKAKAHALGIEKLAFYDLFAPLGEALKKYTYQEGQTIIVDLFSKFHPPMGEFAQMAFDQEWIDSEPREGKVGGAYCTSFPLRKETRVLANWDGSFDSLSTVAHELGHAYHDYVTKDLPALLRSYPMTLAETASIFSQLLIFEGALKESSADERVVLIEGFLQDATQTCVDILSRFYFEKEFFALRAKGDLTGQQINRIMEESQKRSYGDALDEEALHKYMWALKSHYYSSDLSFYNFPYAFGLLFGLGVYQQGQKRPEFAREYDELLLFSAQESAEKVAASASLDITKSSFWEGSMAVIEKYVDEFCHLVGYEEEN
ncbi:MAG: M3 family oligoendopeptidase [Sphaerochaetaceae bacterium]